MITFPATFTLWITNKVFLESSLPTVNINTSSAVDRTWTNSRFLLVFTPISDTTQHPVPSRSCSHCAPIMINQSLKENIRNENMNYTASLVIQPNTWEIQLARKGSRIMCEMFDYVSPFQPFKLMSVNFGQPKKNIHSSSQMMTSFRLL